MDGNTKKNINIGSDNTTIAEEELVREVIVEEEAGHEGVIKGEAVLNGIPKEEAALESFSCLHLGIASNPGFYS